MFSDYVVGQRGPVFMTLLEKTFGRDITTRTWDAVRKVAEPSPSPKPLARPRVVKKRP